MFDLKKFSLGSTLLLLQSIGSVVTRPTFVNPDAHLGDAGGDDGGGGFLQAQPHHQEFVNADHHGGVSIVGAGGSSHKGITLDLTKHSSLGGGGHVGLFGGSFISLGGGSDVGEHHGDGGSSGLGAYGSALSSYDVAAAGGETHDAGEVSPVLYSSFKEGEHHFGLHAGAHLGTAAMPSHLGGGFHLDHSAGFQH